MISYWCLIVTWLLRDTCIRLQNLSNYLEFDLSRSLNIKCDGAIGFPIFGFLLIVNLWSHSAPLQDIRLQYALSVTGRPVPVLCHFSELVSQNLPWLEPFELG